MSTRSKAQVWVIVVWFLFFGTTVARAQAENPWAFLHDFKPFTNGIARVNEHYIAALLHEEERDLFAVVIFGADCNAEGCEVHNAAAYSVFNSEGIKIREYVDPQEEELIQIISSGLPV